MTADETFKKIRDLEDKMKGTKFEEFGAKLAEKTKGLMDKVDAVTSELRSNIPESKKDVIINGNKAIAVMMTDSRISLIFESQEDKRSFYESLK